MPGYYKESSCEISKCTWAGLNHSDKEQNYTFSPHFNNLSFPPLTTIVDVALKDSLMHFFYFQFSMKYNIKCTKLKCTALLILESVCLCHFHPDQNVEQSSHHRSFSLHLSSHQHSFHAPKESTVQISITIGEFCLLFRLHKAESYNICTFMSRD